MYRKYNIYFVTFKNQLFSKKINTKLILAFIFNHKGGLTSSRGDTNWYSHFQFEEEAQKRKVVAVFYIFKNAKNQRLKAKSVASSKTTENNVEVQTK